MAPFHRGEMLPKITGEQLAKPGLTQDLQAPYPKTQERR